MSGIRFGRNYRKMAQAVGTVVETSEMAIPNTESKDAQMPRLDLSHGFIRNIIYHQVVRDEYDKMVKAKTDVATTGKKHKNSNARPFLLYVPPHRRQSALQVDDRASENHKRLSISMKEDGFTCVMKASENSNARPFLLYVPPHRRQSALQVDDRASENHKRDVKNPWLRIANEDSPERLAIRKRLEKEMEGKEREVVIDDLVVQLRSIGQSSTGKFSSKAPFVLCYCDKDGNNLKQIVRSDDSVAGLAKMLARRMGLNDKECNELFAQLEAEMCK
ncbi:hypothetical protein Tcan_14930 [Toxocara canis]|uniref:Uncharacterized protein n=1 Tax=Toxocara canis TaxID=6265 RepID=A0A0B2UZZ7_TOXCA|nr:hypothetical protein Tcan_14930 [Toxocara canis]